MTPANIRAIRMRIGLTISEAAELFRMPIKDVENCERSNSFIIPGGYLEELKAVETAMWQYVDAVASRAPPLALIGYRSLEALLHYEPDAAPLRANTVHRMALAQCQIEMQAESLAPAPIIELRETAYEAWRAGCNLPENMATRIQWALEFSQKFRIKEGGY